LRKVHSILSWSPEKMDWIQFKVVALSYFIGWMVAIAIKKS